MRTLTIAACLAGTMFCAVRAHGQTFDAKSLIERHLELQAPPDPIAEQRMRDDFARHAHESQRHAAEAPVRDALEGHEETIMRTIELVFSSPESPEEYLDAMGEVVPEQAAAVDELLEKFTADMERLDKIRPELVAEYERRQGRRPQRKEIDTIIQRAKSLRTRQLRLDLERELFIHQRVAISNWNPERCGLRISLTETPVGDALGLTEKQKKEIRERSQEIGSRFREAWYQAKRDSLKLYEDVLTEEQVAKLNEVFVPNGGKGIPFVPTEPDEILNQMPYEFYRPDDLEARKKYGTGK
jgi:hypothetical protein